MEYMNFYNNYDNRGEKFIIDTIYFEEEYSTIIVTENKLFVF